MRTSTVIILAVSCSVFVFIIIFAIVCVFLYRKPRSVSVNNVGYHHVRQHSFTLQNIDEVLPSAVLNHLERPDPCSVCFEK
jgi:hypothetical protein